jgi:FkbM family methyltransferase
VFVDVGANMGFFSLFAASQGAFVIAIEPHPSLFSRLEINMRLNNICAALFNEAAGATTTQSILVPGKGDLGSSKITASADGLLVRTRPLLDIILASGVTKIDALKIDIEGNEDVVLMAFMATAPTSLWPRLIIMEHSSHEEWGTDIIKILTSEMGYVSRGKNRANLCLSRM